MVSITYVREQLGSSPRCLKLFMDTKNTGYGVGKKTMENTKRTNVNYFKGILIKAVLLRLLCQPIRLEVV